MATISELLIKIGADNSGLTKALGDTKQQIDTTFKDVSPLNEMQGALTSTTGKVEALLGSFTKFAAVAAGGFGLTSLISSSVEAGESLYQLQRRLGVTTAEAGQFKKILAAVNAFLESLDEEEEPEPPPPPEKPLKESVRELIERCRDREKRIVMLKEAGEWCWTMFFRGTVFFFLFVLTIWGTIWALDFSENHRIKFYPPDEVVAYLTAEHENLEEAAYRMTPLVGRDDNLPFERFDAKLIETVRPIRIYSDEYGIYFMTSKDWYNGEHGIFIAKDEENMPPDINWGLIEGRIYTYAIYD